MRSGQQSDISNCQDWKYPRDMVSSCSRMTTEDCEDCSRCYYTELSGISHLKWIKGRLSAAIVLIALAVTERPSKQLCGRKWIKNTPCMCEDDIAVIVFWTLCCIVVHHTQRSSTSVALCEDVLHQTLSRSQCSVIHRLWTFWKYSRYYNINSETSLYI